MSEAESPPTQPLFLVGVAEQALFWKDIRRVLFSNARFRVLCRVGQDNLKNFWTPVKLAPVLDLMIPGFGSQVNNLSGLLTSINQSSETKNKIDPKQQLINDTLINFTKLIAERYELNITDQVLSEVNVLSKQHQNSFNTQQEKLNAFRNVEKFLLNRFGFEREPLAIARLRESALEKTGIDYIQQPVPLKSSILPLKTSENERFLDTEFIAIYW